MIRRFDSFKEAASQWQGVDHSSVDYPFQSLGWGLVFADRFGQIKNVYLLGIYTDDKLIAGGSFEKIEDRALWLGMKPVLGGHGITDYGDILISSKLKAQNSKLEDVWKEIIEHFRKEGIKTIQLDNVREDSRTYESLSSLKFKSLTEITKQQVAPYIRLPGSWEEYLANLPRIKRKELKRKVKRMEGQNPVYQVFDPINQGLFSDFIRLHRLSDPAKEKFMTDKMRDFFWDMTQAPKDSWQTKLHTLELAGKMTAAVLTFEDSDKMLLYNSGYDPQYGRLSVGLVLKAFMIRQAIQDSKKIFDFMRGSERYKYDLGAKDMNLHQIHIKL